VLSVDQAVSEDTIDKIKAVPGVISARSVAL
jgi:hypothetical protein